MRGLRAPLQSYDIIGTMERWWGSSHDWHAALGGYRLFGKERLGRQAGGDVRAAGLCLDMGEEASGEATQGILLLSRGGSG